MITATLNGDPLPTIEQKFINTNLENAVDVVTLDNTIYTDFVDNNYDEWVFNYVTLTEEQYDLIREKYDLQFTDYEYPLLSIPFYGVVDVPVRMYINEKDIWNNCGAVQGVQLRFRETAQLTDGGS